MSNKFKAIVIDNQNENFTRQVKEMDTNSLKDGNVLVKIDYSGLNYKDALILNNGGRIVKKYPFIPGIDFSGTVEESEDDKFKKGDKIILTGFRVGEVYFGGFAGYAKVNSSFLVKTPKELTNLQTMMMGTAGFTALLCSFAIKAREELLMGEKVKDVLVTGATGGVGSIAVMVLSKMGYEVHVAETNQIGSSTGSIKNYIEDAYQNWNNPPEYIVLVGDTGGSYAIPYFSTTWGSSDFDYTLIDGLSLLAGPVTGKVI